MSSESEECQQPLNDFDCQNQMKMILNDDYQKNIKQVIDACSFSNEDLFLTKTNVIYCYRQNEVRKIQCNQKLKRIFSFHGELYGLTKHHLVVLSMDYYDTSFCRFSKVKLS